MCLLVGVNYRNSLQEFISGIQGAFHLGRGKASWGGRAPEAEYIQKQEKHPGVELSPGLGL